MKNLKTLFLVLLLIPSARAELGKVVRCPLTSFNCSCMNMLGTPYTADNMTLACTFEVCVDNPPLRTVSSAAEPSAAHALIRDKFTPTCNDFCGQYMNLHNLQSAYWTAAVKLGPEPLVCEASSSSCNSKTFALKSISDCVKPR